VIWDVSLKSKGAEIVAMIGANGAGNNHPEDDIEFLSPKRGEIIFEGIPIHRMEPIRLSRREIVHCQCARTAVCGDERG